MDDFAKQIIWRQFGAAIDTLKNAINACPDDLWGDNSKYHQYWYMVYHTLFWLDYYLTADPDNYTPPGAMTMSEFDPKGGPPERLYSKAELLEILAGCREKCRETVLQMTPERAQERYKFTKRELTIGELLLYNLRHVQHHAAQLNMILRFETNSAPGWVFSGE